MKTIAKAIIASLLVASVLSGCNTVHGFGRDVSGTGHAIQRAS